MSCEDNIYWDSVSHVANHAKHIGLIYKPLISISYIIIHIFLTYKDYTINSPFIPVP